jgi:phosphoenolpyruvate carboxykinase (ATP)
MDYKALLQQALKNKEGSRLQPKVLSVTTGEFTARCAHAKYIVDEDSNEINWNETTKPLEKNLFDQYWNKAKQHELISKHYTVGQCPYALTFSLHTELFWHQAFAQNLFFQPLGEKPQWDLICIPSFRPSLQHREIIAISLSDRKILIAGTGYAGEIKKAMFTVMNYLLPKQGVLPLHCSAILNQRHETSLLLGLSGTGKTSLCATGDKIIGDDEHAWTADGIINLEAGCYAKCANLSPLTEKEIYQAIHEKSILENVIIENGHADFTKLDLTENIRAAFPLDVLSNRHKGLAPHPKNIILLCCDLYGVIPPVSLLSKQQAIAYFLCGYTARVGSTEANGDLPIEPVSSPCFGKPFFPLDFNVYADLLSDKIHQHQCKVWLVNTGWNNGDIHTRVRTPLQSSKAIIDAIINHRIQDTDLSYCPTLKLNKVNTFMTMQHPALYLNSDWEKTQRYVNNLKIVQTFIQSTLGERYVY